MRFSQLIIFTSKNDVIYIFLSINCVCKKGNLYCATNKFDLLFAVQDILYFSVTLLLLALFDRAQQCDCYLYIFLNKIKYITRDRTLDHFFALSRKVSSDRVAHIITINTHTHTQKERFKNAKVHKVITELLSRHSRKWSSIDVNKERPVSRDIFAEI